MKSLVKINKDSNISINDELVDYLDPDYICLPVTDTNKYKLNDYIYMGTKIDKHIASISGRIVKIFDDSITIENDFRELSNLSINKMSLSNIELLMKCKDIKNIVVCAINDEPYVYNRIFILKNKIKDILETLNKISKHYKTQNNLIAIKNNESFIIDECLNVLGTYPNIKIALLNDEYLVGRKKFLLKKLNMDNKTLFLTLEELLIINNLLNGYLETTKFITIAGDAINKSMVIRVKLGTSLKSIISRYFKISNKNVRLIINGLMTGYESLDGNIYITNDINCILIMNKRNLKEHECINCGLCTSICPEGLRIYSNKNMDKCIKCGLCSYICPSNINLRKFLGDNYE